MQKGITPVIAIVLLLMITISIIGFASFFFSQTAQTAANATEDELNAHLKQAGTQAQIEGNNLNNVFVRNTGITAIPLTSMAFFVNGQMTSANGPAVLNPGEIGTYTLDNSGFGSMPATSEIKVSAGTFSTSIVGLIKSITGTIISMGRTLLPGVVVAQSGTSIIFQNSTLNTIAIMTDQGFMGIGTVSPLEMLHVVGRIRSDTGFCIAGSCISSWPSGGGGTASGWTTTATAVYNNTPGVTIGIGTTGSPAAQLTITAPTTTAGLRVNNSLGDAVLSADTTGNGYVGTFTGGKFFRLYSGGLERVRFDSGGGIGINNSNPGKALDVSGEIRIRDITLPALRMNNMNNEVAISLSSGATPTLLLGQNNPGVAGTVAITSAGNVGVGIVNPGIKFQVQGSGEIVNIGLRGGSVTDSYFYITENSGASPYMSVGSYLGNVAGPAALVLQSAGGNVGIGTTAPTQTLTVLGTGNVTGQMILGNTRCGAGNVLTTDVAGLVSCVADQTGGGPAAGTGWATSATAVYNNTAGAKVGIGTAAPTSLLHLVSGVGVSPLRIDSSSGPNFLTIDSTGNVGIGTTSTTHEFTLLGTGNTTIVNITDGGRTFGIYLGTLAGGGSGATIGTVTNHPFRLYTNNIDRLTIDTLGNVGIGITSPTQTLTVLGTGNVTGAMILGNTRCGAGNVLTTNAGGLVSCVADQTTGGVTNTGWTTTSNFVYNDTAGVNVGIGTSSTLGRLEISSPGASNNQFIRMNDTDLNGKVYVLVNRFSNTPGLFSIFDASPTGGPRLAIDTNGNVGIGTTAPAQKLHIFGSSKFESGTMFANYSYVSFTTPTPSGGGFTGVPFIFTPLVNYLPSDMIWEVRNNNGSRSAFWVMGDGSGNAAVSFNANLFQARGNGNTVTLQGSAADSATAVGYAFNNLNTLTTAGAKLASFRNVGVEKAFIDKDGGAFFNSSVTINGALTVNSCVGCGAGGGSPTIWAGAPQMTVPLSTTTYGMPTALIGFNAVEAVRQLMVTSSRTARNLYVRTNTTQPATGNLVITLRKNGAPTAVTFTILAGSAPGVYGDPVNTAPFAAGDMLSIEYVNQATAVSANIWAHSVELA